MLPMPRLICNRKIVMALAGSPEGKNIIFRKVRKGELLAPNAH